MDNQIISWLIFSIKTVHFTSSGRVFCGDIDLKWMLCSDCTVASAVDAAEYSLMCVNNTDSK